MQLFHISDDRGIFRFEPRPAPASSNLNGNFVWAVDEDHLPNYLLPRDCPRVCFARSSATTETDATRFLEYSQSNRVIAVEWNWMKRICESALYIYSLPSETFECIDSGAGYYVSPVAIRPIASKAVDDVLAELSRRNIELRFMHDLWPLHDAIANSSLEFSMIRMRNASKKRQ